MTKAQFQKLIPDWDTINIWMDQEAIQNRNIHFGMGIRLKKFQIWTNFVMGRNIYIFSRINHYDF
jgi:hypothetical protein